MPHPRNPKNWCPCGAHIRNSRSGLCKSCWAAKKAVEYGETLLKDVPIPTAARHKHQSVRHHAHRLVTWVYKWEKVCKICSYSTYVELCHVISIASFLEDAPLKEINSKDNLAFLCPNHHKELDIGILKL